ncbi:MAG: DUF3225 domain-containing protein [Acidobacteria bacterium]|nr:MAG: DUF3225 domain-containing protein [Acidobacteriota bacterium]
MNYGRVVCRCVLVLSLVGVSRAAGKDTAAAEIARLVVQYARSVDAADTKLASEVWANEADVSFIHPSGHERGWEAIKANIYERIMRDFFSERKLDVKDIVVHVYRDAAWVEFYWDFVAKLRTDGTALTTHGRESQVYRKSGGRWRLVHVHYAGMPVTEERRGF